MQGGRVKGRIGLECFFLRQADEVLGRAVIRPIPAVSDVSTRRSDHFVSRAEIDKLTNRQGLAKSVERFAAALRQIEDRKLLGKESPLFNFFAGLGIGAGLGDDVPEHDFRPFLAFLTCPPSFFH